MSEKKTSKRARSKDLTDKLSKDELLRRLKSIMEELANVDQDENTENYGDLAATLVTSFLVNHRDKDIRVCLACCFADILRIYAPEAPYNEEQLKSIFELILSQLKIIENPENALFKRAYYLLESLAMVKSFNVCCEIEAQELVTKLFKTFFNIINEKHNVKVRNFILDVLSAIIQESESLSQEILDAILSNLVDPRKTAKPSSYKLAASLIERCSTSLEPYLQIFFNDSLVLGKETDSYMEKHIYDLILELNRISKTILLSVLPQLDFKLKSVEEEERLDVVRVLGTMFSEEDSDLSNLNKPLWKSFLDRFIDISAEVRVECVQSGKQLLISKPDLCNDVSDRILERFHDTEEKVRLQAVVSVCEAAAERISVVADDLISAVKERMRDKKWPVRRAALTCIAKLYKGVALCDLPNSEAVSRMAWAPNKILHSYYQNSIEDRLCVERIVHGCLVPVSLDTEQRMKVLLRLYASLEDYALKAFDFLLKHRSSINNEMQKLLELHEEDSNEKEKKIFGKILTLARSLPEPFKAQENLKKLVAMFKDKTLFDLLKVASDIEQGCEKIKKAVAEIVKKISSKNPIIETVKSLLDRSCHMLVDAHSLRVLLSCVKKSIEGMDEDDNDDDDDGMEEAGPFFSKKAERGLMLLKTLSSVMPVIFKTEDCYKELLQLIKHSNNFVVESGLRILYNVGEDLESFDRSLCSMFQPALSKLATSGTRGQAMYAIRCLSRTLKDSTLVMERIMNTLMDSLNYDSKKLFATMAALGEIAAFAPSIFETKHKTIIREFLVKDLMINDRENSKDSQDSENEWGDDDDVSRETILKVQGIKLMVKWLLGLQSNHANAATPVFRLLNTVLQNDGDVNGNGGLGNKDKSRMRLAAANGVLKLMENPNYTDGVTIDQFLQLSLTVQDSCYEVRQKFSVKLHKALEVLKLPLDYLALFMLSAVDPCKERRTQARQMIAKNVQTRRDYMKQNATIANRPYTVLPEYALPYAIYLMANHPDFDPKRADSVSDTKEYLWFFLEPLLGTKAENSSFLKKLAENIKQVKDARDPENESLNERLYMVCDIVIWLLTNKTHTMILKEFPGNPVLPKKLFNVEKKNPKPNLKNYLPASFHLPPKPKKTPVVDVKMVNAKGNTTKKTTKVRTKQEEQKKSTRKEAGENPHGDSSETSLSGTEDEVEVAQHKSAGNEEIVSNENPSNSTARFTPKRKRHKMEEESQPKEQGGKKITEASMALTDDEDLNEDLIVNEPVEDLEEDLGRDSSNEAKPKRNIRMGSIKRNAKATLMDTSMDIDAPTNRTKSENSDVQTMSGDDESERGNDQNEEPLDEKPAEEPMEEESAVIEEHNKTAAEDASIVINVKRKSKRRR